MGHYGDKQIPRIPKKEENPVEVTSPVETDYLQLLRDPAPEETPVQEVSAPPATQISEDPPAEKPAKPPKTRKEPKPGASRKKQQPEEDEAEADKDKYSIYLPKKLSMSLRMVYIITRKKYSHIAEVALTDMLYRRYQCESPACCAKFSMSETDIVPTCCPACGGNKISPLRIDILD